MVGGGEAAKGSRTITSYFARLDEIEEIKQSEELRQYSSNSESSEILRKRLDLINSIILKRSHEF